MVKKNQQLLEETSADYERGNIQDFYDVSFDIDEDKKKQQKKPPQISFYINKAVLPIIADFCSHRGLTLGPYRKVDLARDYPL